MMDKDVINLQNCVSMFEDYVSEMFILKRRMQESLDKLYKKENPSKRNVHAMDNIKHNLHELNLQEFENYISEIEDNVAMLSYNERGTSYNQEEVVKVNFPYFNKQ